MSMEDIYQKMSCWVPDAKRLHRCNLKVSTKLSQEMQDKEAGNIQGALLASQFLSAMPLPDAVKVLVSIVMSVGWSSKGKPLKLRHHDVSRAHFQGAAQRLVYVRLPAEDRRKYSMTTLESEDKNVSQDLAVLVHEQKNALVWLNKNQLADLKSYDRAIV